MTRLKFTVFFIAAIFATTAYDDDLTRSDIEDEPVSTSTNANADDFKACESNTKGYFKNIFEICAGISFLSITNLVFKALALLLALSTIYVDFFH
ncbi:hypothetical protein ACKWTF_015749 [Chironomus riparius]